MTHKTKDCLERPRSKGAKWTNKNIAPDEKVEDIKLTGFESKRDRWNGYDAKEYTQIVDRFEQLEELRKEIKKKEQVSGWVEDVWLKSPDRVVSTLVVVPGC